MTYVQNESTAALRYKAFYLVDTATGLTGQTGLTFSGSEIQVAQNDTVSNADNIATVMETGSGGYILEYSAAELSDLGVISIRVAKAGCRVFVDSDPVRAADVGTGFVVNEDTVALRYKPLYIVDSATGLTGQNGLTFSDSDIQVAKNNGGYQNGASQASVLSVSTWGLYLYPYSAAELDTQGTVWIKVVKTSCRTIIDSDTVRPEVTGGGGSSFVFPVLANATTAGAIRDRMYDVVEALSPDLLTGDRFARYRNEGEGRFDRWCAAHPAGVFRRVQIRDSGRREPPEGTNLGYEWHTVTFRIMVAYPQTARYGVDQALDRDDTADDDFRLIHSAVGWGSKFNFVGSATVPDATPLGCVELDRESVDGVDFLVCEARFQYIRDMQA